MTCMYIQDLICSGVLTDNVYSFRLVSKVIYTYGLFLGLMFIMHVFCILTLVFVQRN